MISARAPPGNRMETSERSRPAGRLATSRETVGCSITTREEKDGDDGTELGMTLITRYASPSKISYEKLTVFSKLYTDTETSTVYVETTRPWGCEIVISYSPDGKYWADRTVAWATSVAFLKTTSTRVAWLKSNLSSRIGGNAAWSRAPDVGIGCSRTGSAASTTSIWNRTSSTQGASQGLGTMVISTLPLVVAGEMNWTTVF
eukprot:3938942-Rhodomonas_salina.3